MARRTQQRRREEARAQKTAQRAVECANGSYVPPPREECQEKRHTIPLDDEGRLRILVMYWRQGGTTTEFVQIIQLREQNDEWMNRARIDCCHGVCHVHDDDDEPVSTRLMSLDSAGDVEKAWDRADIEIRAIADSLINREAEK